MVRLYVTFASVAWGVRVVKSQGRFFRESTHKISSRSSCLSLLDFRASFVLTQLDFRVIISVWNSTRSSTRFLFEIHVRDRHHILIHIMQLDVWHIYKWHRWASRRTDAWYTYTLHYSMWRTHMCHIMCRFIKCHIGGHDTLWTGTAIPIPMNPYSSRSASEINGHCDSLRTGT